MPASSTPPCLMHDPEWAIAQTNGGSGMTNCHPAPGTFGPILMAAQPVMFPRNAISAANCARGCRQIRETPMSERIGTLIGGALAGAMTVAMFQFAAAGAQAADYDVGSIHVTQP